MATVAATGWSAPTVPRADGLRQALLTASDERSFCDVPCDWWDDGARVWRPTAIIRVVGGVWDASREVEVLVPAPGGTSLLRVSMDVVRLSRLLTAGVARYWLARYRRVLLLSLIEKAPASGMEAGALRRAASLVRHDETLARDTWVTAYATGSPDGVEEPVDTRPDIADPVLACTAAEAPLVERAVGVLARDLLRIDAALAAAGLGSAERAAHPLAAGIAGLLRAAPVAPALSRAGSAPRPV